MGIPADVPEIVMANPPVTKRVMKVGIRAGLLTMTDGADSSPPGTLARVLAEEPAVERRRTWLARNAESIAAYNESVETHAVFSIGRRTF